MLNPANRAKIDDWISESPEFRQVETESLAEFRWHTRAIEDGEVVYEEVDVDTEEPVLNLLAAWCERHTKIEPRPPVKAGTVADVFRTGSKSR